MQKMGKTVTFIGVVKCLVTVLFVTMLMGGCEKNKPMVENPSSEGRTVFVESEIVAGEMKDYATYIGLTDMELISKKGEGAPAYREGSDHLLSARTYQETLFGIFGESTFAFSDDGLVCEVTFKFVNAAANDVINLISQDLGDAISVHRVGATMTALWHNDGNVYQLNDEDGMVYLIIAKDYVG